MPLPAIDPNRDSLSHWHASAEPMVPGTDLPPSAEVTVIGGGMLGCWTAYWLARAGVDVVVLERTAIGWGATGRNGGFLVGGTPLAYPRLVDLVGLEAARSLHQVTMDGQRLAFEVIASEEIECDLRQNGTLGLALDGADRGAVGPDDSLMHGDGAATRRLDRAQVQDLIATPLGGRVTGGWFAPGDGTLHSSRYLAGIARAAERHGARFVQATVESIAGEGDSVRIMTSLGNLTSGHAVIALNAWSDTLVPELSGLVVPVRGQILSYEPVPDVFRTAVGVDVTPTGEYWQQLRDGSIVIGGCRELAPGADVGIREMVPTKHLTDRIERILPDLFPELSSLKVARRWAGLMAFTSDRLPVADLVPGVEHAWVAGGFSGHGMTFGPRLGQLLADAVTTGSRPAVLESLRIDRPSLCRMAERA